MSVGFRPKSNVCLVVLGLFFSVCLFAQGDSLSDTSQIYTFVEKNPEFPGGESALIKFLQQNIIYPVLERDNDIQGKVILRFVVKEDGSVSDVRVVRKASPGLDKEAVRVVKMLPKFKPGIQNGKAVSVYYNLPISFNTSICDTCKLPDPRVSNVVMKVLNDENFKKASLKMKDNDYEGAINLLNESIKYFPNDYLGYEAKGDCEIKIGKLIEACNDYKKAKELGSLSAFLYLKKNCGLQLDTTISQEDFQIYTAVDQMPEFPGGEAALNLFIDKHIKYPATELDKFYKPKVMMRFVVEKDGSVDNVQIIQGIAPDFDAEALRVTRTLPRFIPGKQKGVPVRAYYKLPVEFFSK